MLIGIDASRAVAKQRTGTENYSAYLIRALVRQGAGHRFRLYFNEPPQDDLLPQGKIVEWRVMPFPRLWTHLRLAWEVTTHPPDVLLIPAHVLPLVHPRVCVAVIHDLGYLAFPQTHESASRRYLDLSTRFTARHARRLVVDSQATRQDLERHYGLDPSKVRVAYPAGAKGLAPVRDPQRIAEVRRRYRTGEVYYLYVGTIQPRKNLVRLIEAFGALIAEGRIGPEVHLVLAGKVGWLSEEILGAAQAASLAGRVSLPGYIPQEDLAALMSGALAFVYPSLYEGFGLPILEAMACETPVICSNSSSLPEVAGDAALLVDAHDGAALAEAMASLYHQPALRRALAERGREQARLFSWERCAREVLAALEEAAGGEG